MIGSGLPLIVATLTLAPHALATRTDVPPQVDGRLDDGVWQTATVSDRFTQYAPADGQSPSERTSVRVLYDAEALYVGVYCEQRSSPIVGHLVRRDADSESDNVTIFLDTRGEGKDAFWVSVNVAGVQADGTLHDQNIWGLEWDENWDVGTAVGPDWWSAEFRVPFRALRFRADLPAQNWGLQVVRFIAARQEADQWAHVPRDNVNWVANYGRLDGITGTRGSNIVEVRPFGVSRLARRDAGGETVGTGNDWQWSGGLDLRLHLSDSLVLDGAIRPDFTQVEADQIILNLSNYETFLPEKRSLFIEGADIFVTPMENSLLFGSAAGLPNRTFYSRRIGSPPVPPPLREDAVISERLVRPAEPSAILAAAKLIGAIGGGWSIGALSAVVGANELVIQDVTTGTRSPRLADPTTAFNVLRIKHVMGARGHVGLIATGVRRLESGAVYPSDGTGMSICPAGQIVSAGSRCFRDAYVGAVDGHWQSEDGKYLLAGQLTGSAIENGPSTSAPDGTTVSSGDRGASTWARAARVGGKHVLLSAEYMGATPKIDYNDVGYMARANLHEVRSTIVYRTLDPGTYFLDTSYALSVLARWNARGLDLGQTCEASLRLRLNNFWITSGKLEAGPSRFDDREIGNGLALQRPAWMSGQLGVSTDPRSKVVAAGTVQGLRHEMGAGGSAQIDILLHALPQFDIQIGPQVTGTYGEIRYAPRAVETGGDYLFGRLRATSASIVARASYLFTPRVSLQAYAQLFAAAGHYTDFHSLPQTTPPGAAVGLSDLSPAPAPSLNPDFEQVALNANVVFRWEYKLGSTLYLVYSRSQVPEVTLDAGQAAAVRVTTLRDRPATDVIMLKASLWWTH